MTSLLRVALIAGLTVVACRRLRLRRRRRKAPRSTSSICTNGSKVKSPFLVQFGLSGMGVAPAGVEKPDTGHHHLLIDTKLTPEQMKAPLPADEHHKHFGGGQTEAMIALPKGKHTLQLVLGDWSHVPFSPPVMSPAIAITVR